MVAPSAIFTPGPNTTCGSIVHVAAELGVVREPDAFRVDQGRALLQRLPRRRRCQSSSRCGQLGAAVDPGGLERLALDRDRVAALVRRRS